jgi:hypothetical protein
MFAFGAAKRSFRAATAANRKCSVARLAAARLTPLAGAGSPERWRRVL